jgi:4-aminobutyrate aminotransferase/(S)-3-amino-2-methylpropionate transaminase
MFASDHYGLEPDLFVTAKSLAGGLPLSAVTGRSEIMDSSQVGGLGGTYSGNPVSCAAAIAAIDFIEREKLPERARAIGNRVQQKFIEFSKKCSFIGDVRGLGAMMAMEFVKDRDSKEPHKEFTNEVIRKCYEKGLILIAAGTYGNVIRTLMPLTIPDDQMEEGLEVMEYALQ